MISHIVAAAQNGVIGAAGELPWDIPEDLKFFKDTTKGHCLIMGRKTFESIGHPLPHRLSVVVSRQEDLELEGATVFSTIEAAIEFCRTQKEKYGEEIFIIGGGEIFRKSIDVVDRIYLTRIHKDFPGDITYPEVDLQKFKQIACKESAGPPSLSFLTFHRI